MQSSARSFRLDQPAVAPRVTSRAPLTIVDHVASADGTPIAVHRRGNGPPLVLVHGAAADHARWAPVLPALAEQFTVLAIDRRGRGASGDAAEYALAREAEDVAAVAEAADEPAVVLGHSYGGIAALEAALLTDAIAALVLYEAPVGYVKPPGSVVRRLRDLAAHEEWDALLRCFFERVAGLPPEQVQLLRSLPAWQARVACAPTILREEEANRRYEFEPARFDSLAVPTLLVEGGESSEPFKIANRALLATLPGAHLVSLPGQRHAAMDTGTELFLDAVIPFIHVPSPKESS